MYELEYENSIWIKIYFSSVFLSFFCDQVYTWGHRLVTPRRVIISRNLKKAGNTLLNFHRRRPLRLTAIAAGMVHSLALAEDGAFFYWVSSDSNLRCQQVGFNLLFLS